jgi:hypothetical protein
MVKIANSVWTRWHELSDESSKPYIEMLLKSDSAEALAPEVQLVVRQILQEHWSRQDELGPGEDEVGGGAWGVAPVPDGVLITVGQKAEAFEDLLGAIQAELTTRGTSGTIVLYEPPPLELPEWWLYTSARRQVSGAIWLDSEKHEVDADRFELLARDAIGWCLSHAPDIGVFTSCLDLPELAVRLDEDPWEALSRLPSGYWKGLTSLSSTGYRQVFLHTFPGYHAVSVLVGSAAENYDWVESAREVIREFLIDHAATTYYSMINTHYGIGSGGSGSSPANGHNVNRNFPRNLPPFKDHRLADFFSTQILGPNFARPAPHPDWTQTQLPDRRLLLEHSQPARWLGPDDPFPARRRWPVPEFPGPELIATTRTHFADLCIPQRENSLTWDQVAKAERIAGHAPGSGPGTQRLFSIVLADGRTEDNVWITSEGGVWRPHMEGPPLEIDASQVIDLVHTPRD